MPDDFLPENALSNDNAPSPSAPQPRESAREQVAVNAQYIKDFSFENPRAPGSLIAAKERPNIDIEVDINVQRLQAENAVFEVSLHITTKASVKERPESEALPLFMADLTYAGVFSLMNIAEEQMNTVLTIYAPSLLFPFARRVIADATRDGGFPPLMLEPIDFAGLQLKRKN